MSNVSAQSVATFPDNSTFSKTDWNALADMWYPLALEEEVGKKPIAKQVLDIPIVIARLGEEYVVAKDLCVHLSLIHI